MSAFESIFRPVQAAAHAAGHSLTVFLRDAGHGLLEVCHNSLALVGLTVVGLSLFFASRADVRQMLEERAYDWLHSRQEARQEADDSPAGLAAALTEAGAVMRATAADPRQLDRQQSAVANWLARRYRVAPEPLSRLVQEAWAVGQRAKVEPTLILSIMAIESGFNPFAQSSVGAQGLMQVLTRVHDDKYVAFGGNHAAFDPVTNLRVGVQVLKECISRAGSLEGGLRHYVGAANLPHDGGYAGKVLAEQAYLRQVASGQRVAFNAPLIPLAPSVPAALPADAASAAPPAAAPALPVRQAAAEQRVAWR
jgi:hypothetical protein